jgi:hypothetical protein
MKYLLILLAALSMSASADWEARSGSDRVRLTEAPCTSAAVLEQIAARAMDAGNFRTAIAFVGGRTYNACWTNEGIAVRLIYEDGDHGMIPRGQLSKIESI